MSEQQPLVSVIIPNYNYERYLKLRIDSVLNQSFEDFEVILLDDASTDGSAEVIKKYQSHPKVSEIIFNKENSGSPFVQWMKGVKMARGKLIWIAEADDLSSPDFLVTCIARLQEFPEAVACMVGSCFIDSSGAKIERKCNYWDKKKSYTDVGYRCINGQFYASHKLYWSNCIQNTSATIFRRDAAMRLVHSPFLSMRSAGDWLFWFQMAMQGSIVETYEKLNYFRIHEKKVTEKAKKGGSGIKEDIAVIHYMEQHLSGLGRYKRSLCHGILYHKFKHLSLDKSTRMEILALMNECLGFTPKEHVILNINRYLRYIFPCLLTWERDRVREE